MTNEALIINQARKIADLEIERNQYKDWYYKATEEIKKLNLEIQQLQQKLNGSENTL